MSCWVGKQKIIDLGKREEQAKKGGAGRQQTVLWQMKVKDVFKIVQDFVKIGCKFSNSLQTFCNPFNCKDQISYFLDNRSKQKKRIRGECIIGWVDD